jgi:4-hydroxybenzoate polyprenyltransferase
MTWRVHLRLGRVSNLPTVWTNVLAGVVLAGVPVEPGPLVGLMLALSLFYIGGMYLNDAFDRRIDALERPERPIPSGQISASAVFTVGYAMFAVALAMLAALSLASHAAGWSGVLSGLALTGVVTYYDMHHKANPLSPVLMGFCRVLVYVTAALVVSGRVGGAVLEGALVLLAYLIGLTYAAKQESLARVGNLWPLAFLFAPFVYTFPALSTSLPAAILFVLFLAWVLRCVRLLVVTPPRFPQAVIGFIAGISLLDGLLVAGAGSPALALVACAGFGLTLFLQRYVVGT